MRVFIIFLAIIAFMFNKKLTKGWMSPARISSVIWTFFIIGYNIFSEKNVGYNGMIFLIFSSFCMCIGEYYGVRLKFTSLKNEKKYNIGNIAWYMLMIFIFLAMFYDVTLILKNGFSISDFLDINKYLKMNTTMSYQRYLGDNSKGLMESILCTFIYISALYGGYLFLYATKRKQKFLCIGVMVPSLINVLFQNTKLVLLDSIFLWFVGFVISYIIIYKKNPKINMKILILGGLSVALICAIFFFSMCAKIGKTDYTTIKYVQRRFVVYAFGSVESFTAWFSTLDYVDYGFGINTFLAPFDLLGIIPRIQGVYEFMNGIDSNIFTGFRALINDFGIIGSLVVVVFFGLISGIFYKKLLDSTINKTEIVLFGCCLFTILHYWLGSPWVYSSYWFTFIIFWITLRFTEYNLKNKKSIDL